MDLTSSNNDHIRVHRLLSEIQLGTDRIDGLDLGYPLGSNIIKPASPTGGVEFLSRQNPNYPAVTAFYRLCDGISLPDVGNGIFLHSRELVNTNRERGVPVALRDGGAIAVIGSDGGGGLFALYKEGRSEVLHLPNGAAFQGEFDNIRYPAKQSFASFVELLTRILDDVNAFCEGRDAWQFLA